MTSSTWSCEAARPLIGVGADCESIGRFEALLARDPHPLPSAFTAAEVARARAAPDPARALCEGFCAKEAVAKAIGGPCDLTACELVRTGEGAAPELRLADAFCAEHGASGAAVAIRDVDEAPGQLLAVVYLFA